MKDADLVIACVPVGACGAVAKEIAPHLKAGAIVSDVGSVKTAVPKDMAPHLPDTVDFIPAHPVAGTEHSGPDAGFAELFVNRWCILTPAATASPAAVERLKAFWQALGANVETMTAEHHDLVLAITSHLPHLIAYTIVGTADELEGVTQSEVLKFSAGGFRDFTRIAASDPTMWRDVFLNNKDAVLEMLGEFQEDLSKLTRAIRRGDGDALFEHFTRTRAIRRGILNIGQDAAAPTSAVRIRDCRRSEQADQLEQRRRLREADRAEKHRAVDKPQREGLRRPSLQRRLLAKHATRPPIAAGAFWRTTLPRPGISLSSAPIALSTCSAFRPGARRSSVACGTPCSRILSRPSAGTILSSPATVICNSPSSRPCGVMPSDPRRPRSGRPAESATAGSRCGRPRPEFRESAPAMASAENLSGRSSAPAPSCRTASPAADAAASALAWDSCQTMSITGLLGRRALGDAAVQFGVLGARHRRRDRAGIALQRRIVEHQRHALRRFRQAEDAALRACPVDDQRVLLALLGHGQRRR